MDDSSYITLDIQDPAGQVHEISAPASANVQQFVNSVVSRLNLPVIDVAGDGIVYGLQKVATHENLNITKQLNTSGLYDGDQLRLVTIKVVRDRSHFIEETGQTPNDSMYISVVVRNLGAKSVRIDVEPGNTVQQLIEAAKTRMRLKKKDDGIEIRYVLLNGANELLDSAAFVLNSTVSDGEQLRIVTDNTAKRITRAKNRRLSHQSQINSSRQRTRRRQKETDDKSKLLLWSIFAMVIGLITIGTSESPADSDLLPMGFCLMGGGIFTFVTYLLGKW